MIAVKDFMARHGCYFYTTHFHGKGLKSLARLVSRTLNLSSTAYITQVDSGLGAWRAGHLDALECASSAGVEGLFVIAWPTDLGIPMARRPAAWALACCVLAIDCAALSSHAAFVSPLPSFACGRGRGRAHTAVVAEKPLSTPSIYSAAAGQEEYDTQSPTTEAAVVVVEVRGGKTREEERKSKHFDFLKEVAQNKKQARANKAKFRDQRDEYLEEMRKAFKLMQIKEREESGFKWVKRPRRDRKMPLSELKLGAKHEAVVITVKEHGAYVDFGAKKDGFVRLRDLSDRDFVLDARDYLRPGDTVNFYVKYVSPAEGIVTGSLVPAEIETEKELAARTPLAEVREADELWGEVTKVSNYGAFVDVGVEVQGFLHIIYYPKRAQGALTQDVFRPGMRLRVWAMEVDTEKRRLKLTAERPRSLPRVDYSWYMGGFEVAGSEDAPGRGFVEEMDFQPSYEDGQGLQARGRGKHAMERMQEWNFDDESGRNGGMRRRGEGEKEVVHNLDADRQGMDKEEAALALEEKAGQNGSPASK